MQVPLSWLRDYVDIDVTPEVLADKLTFSGTEVEAIVHKGVCPDGVVVGEILEVKAHPDADKLRLCRVSTGAHTWDVVCGADNVSAGDRAAFAPCGTVLPGGMEIKSRKVRGKMSEGMLCAEDELGLSEDHSGIMLLADDAPVGAALSNVLPEPDIVFRLEVTWNRPDCLSVIGIAREIAALLEKPLRLPDTGFAESGKSVEDCVEINIDAPKRCGRYTARVLTGVSVKESPEWMQRRLELCGVRAISNIVDITNYVMLECGQPLHAFDHKEVQESRIVVRTAKEREAMSTLDGVAHKLDAETLVIADGGGPLALAGIMGGEGSEICQTTDTVLLESAHFDAPGVHRSSVSLAVSSESSHRFERGIDIEQVEWASARAASLFEAHAGALACKGVVDVYPGKTDAGAILCRFARVRQLLGVEILDDEVLRILQSLGFDAKDDGDGTCTVQVPSFRLDIEREADVIEEIARMHGLDDVPVAMPAAVLGEGVDDGPARQVSRCRDQLVSLGLTEIMNYSYVREGLISLFGGDPAGAVILPNPVSSEQSHLRNQLIPQVVESLGRNMSRQVDRAALFEIGRTFRPLDGGDIGESDHVAIGLMGPVGRSGFEARRPVEDDEVFLWVKGILEQLCLSQHVRQLEFVPASDPAMVEGMAVEIIVNGTSCGMMGLITETIRSEWRISIPVGVAELDLSLLVEASLETARVDSLPVYPSILRDIAIIVPDAVRHDEIMQAIRASGPTELTEIVLFDIFRSKRIGHGKKSMAYSLVYQSLARTLTDDEVNTYDRSVIEALQSQLNAEVREG